MYPDIGRSSYRVLCQQWEECSRTLGPRPDSYSLHANQEDLNYCIRRQAEYNRDHGYDINIVPAGTAYEVLVDRGGYHDIERIEYHGGLRFTLFSDCPGPVDPSPPTDIYQKRAATPSRQLPDGPGAIDSNGGWFWSD